MTVPARAIRVPLRGPDLRVLEAPAATPSRPSISAWMVLAVVVVGAFFVLIWSRIALDRSAFELERLDREVAAEESRYWELRLEVTELQAPDRIRQLADEMGMVYPAHVETIEVPALGTPIRDLEERWADLKALLSARP